MEVRNSYLSRPGCRVGFAGGCVEFARGCVGSVKTQLVSKKVSPRSFVNTNKFCETGVEALRIIEGITRSEK